MGKKKPTQLPGTPIMVYCVYCVLSSPLFWTSDLWMHQPGSHRRKVTQGFSTFLLRCLPYIFFSKYVRIKRYSIVGEGTNQRCQSVFRREEIASTSNSGRECNLLFCLPDFGWQKGKHAEQNVWFGYLSMLEHHAELLPAGGLGQHHLEDVPLLRTRPRGTFGSDRSGARCCCCWCLHFKSMSVDCLIHSPPQTHQDTTRDQEGSR